MRTTVKPRNIDTTGNYTVNGIAAPAFVKTDHLMYANGTPYILAGGESVFTSKVDAFTGDGNTVSFTLSTSPASVNNTIVMVGGIQQPKAYYTVTGNNLTFLSAPPSGTYVEVTSLGGSAYTLGVATTVIAGSQPNITQVGNLVNLTVTGNVSIGGNLTATTISGNFNGSSNYSNYVLGNNQPNITSLGTLSNVTVSGNANVGMFAKAGYFMGDGAFVSNIAVAKNVSNGAQPNITSVGSLTGLTVNGQIFSKSYSEPITVPTGTSGVITCDALQSSTFYLTPTANFIPNFTNVIATNGRVVVFSIVVPQGTTPYVPTDFQINGVSTTVKWIGSTAPLGGISKVDVFSYNLLIIGSVWTVLGQYANYG